VRHICAAAWVNDGPPIELVVYPGARTVSITPQLQPGRTMFGHLQEYNGEAADNATHRLHQFLDPEGMLFVELTHSTALQGSSFGIFARRTVMEKGSVSVT